MKRTKRLNIWMLTALVVGNMVGAGIFMVPVSLASIGSISNLSWLLTAFGTICLALVFIDLNQQLPQSGGPYVYSRAAFGDFVGFLTTYCYLLAWCGGNAGMAVALSGYVGYLWPVVNDQAGAVYNPYIAFLVKAGVIWIVAGINILGIRTTGYVQVITTIIKVVPLLLITLVGFSHIHTSYYHPFNATGHSNFSALIASAAISAWAFVGFESATIPSEDASSGRDIRRATIIGTIITALLYLCGSLVIMGMIPAGHLKVSDFPYSDAAQMLFGPKAAVFIAIGAIVSVFGAINGSLLIQVQVGMAAARDGLFLKWYAKKGEHDTPVLGFIITSAVITLLLLSTINKGFADQFTYIVLLSSFAYLIPYFICAAAQTVLLARGSHEFDRKQFIKSMIISLLALAYAFFTMAGAGADAVFFGAFMIFTAFPLYALIRQGQIKKTVDAV